MENQNYLGGIHGSGNRSYIREWGYKTAWKNQRGYSYSLACRREKEKYEEADKIRGLSQKGEKE